MSIESRGCERTAAGSGGAAETAVRRVPHPGSFAERTPGREGVAPSPGAASALGGGQRRWGGSPGVLSYPQRPRCTDG